MSYLGSHKLGDFLTFTINTHDGDNRVADADADPTYRIYEDETTPPILTGTMALLDDANTVGFYSEQIQLLAATGFERGKSYNLRIEATVGGKASAVVRYFQIGAKVDIDEDSNAGRALATLLPIADRNFNNDFNTLLGVIDEPYLTLVDAVWDELRGLHNIPGSFGEGVNVMELDFLREALTDLARAALTIVDAVVDDTNFAPTTTQFESNVTEATADHFNGRAIIFVNGALKDQAILINDTGGYQNVTGNGRFTVSRDGQGTGGLTEAPANGDRFVIV